MSTDSSNDVIDSPQAALDALRHVSPEAACPYLPGRLARYEPYGVRNLGGTEYSRLLAKGFRRSGYVVYRPRCRRCDECRQLRIPVTVFAPSRSMRRVWRRNLDLRVVVDQPHPSAEKHRLYERYLSAQHNGTMPSDYDAFVEFLYASPTQTLELRYYVGRRVVAVSLVDRVADGLSSVYTFFDPEEGTRSPGTFSVMWEIDYCRRQGWDHYYLGYLVAGSRTMSYKARFRPYEVLVDDNRWIRFCDTETDGRPGPMNRPACRMTGGRPHRQ